MEKMRNNKNKHVSRVLNDDFNQFMIQLTFDFAEWKIAQRHIEFARSHSL